jgi:hypothetical protein
VQFHPEATAEIACEWARTDPGLDGRAESVVSDVVDAVAATARLRARAHRRLFDGFLGRSGVHMPAQSIAGDQ